MTPDSPELASLAEGNNGAADHSRFKHQTVNLVGVGIWGTSVPPALDGVHWVYFPESEYVFYRVTVLSNFSPLIVAPPYKQWSLADLAKDEAELKRVVIDGLHRGDMLPRNAS